MPSHSTRNADYPVKSGPGKSKEEVIAEGRADHTKYEAKCADSKGRQGSSKRLGGALK